MCPPGLPRQGGNPLTLPRPPRGLGAVTCVPAECCGRREHRHRDPHWSPHLLPHCATHRQVGRGQRSGRGRGWVRRALIPTSVSDRAPEKETVNRFPLARSRGHLWAHSPEPLRQPPLKRVHANAELRDVACQIFIDILPQPAHPIFMPTPWL